MKKTVFTLVASLFFAMGASAQSNAQIGSGSLLQQGSPMPEIALYDTGGKDFRFSERHVDPAYDIVLFWRTDILPSEKEFKAMKKLVAKYSDYAINIAAISLNTDTTAWHKAVRDMPKDFAQYRLRLSVANAAAVTDSLGLGNLPVVCLSDPDMKLIASTNKADDMKLIVDRLIADGSLTKPQMPVFPGGNTGLKDYIKTKLRYPNSALMAGLQGRIMVNFIVEKDGSVTNASIDNSSTFTPPVAKVDGQARTKQLNDIYEAERVMQDEALRVVRKMPRWKPAMVNGRSVRVKYKLPVHFHF